MGRHRILALATMIFLSYTKLDMNLFPNFSFANSRCSCVNNVTFKLLYIDTSVPYLRDCHMQLFHVSLAVLILLIVPYTFCLLIIPVLEGPLSKYICCCQKLLTYMKSFFEVHFRRKGFHEPS